MQTVNPILILGGTGKTGRRIIDRLEARNVPVRVGSRAGTLAFDWHDRNTWDAALDGVRAVYISYYPDIAIPGAEKVVSALIDLAVKKNVKRLVLLSGRGEEHAQLTEASLMRSDADWTILRCSWFNQNFSEGAFIDSVLAGELAVPAAEIGEPFVDADDIADVAVEVLTSDGHIGQLYELTGPRLLTFREAIAEIADATGRNIAFTRVSAPEFKATLESYGLPAEVVWLLDELFVRVLDGRNKYLTDGVQRVLGRAPKDFSDYAWETAAAGVWTTAA
ncbi:MAG TPA: NAD(P)H-binding protein [Rhizobiaceae bacterium]|nr:NAD(P)H-binding protein [Rhizobiaceae bacterium]